MFDGMDFSKMGAMLQQMQDQAKQMDAEAANLEYTAKSGGGLVRVSINGRGEVNDISIDNSLLSDKESLQILLMSAVNDAIRMVEDGKKHAASQMLAGLGGLGPKN
ncbi:MAG: YbaB/EbfC family nucleoid-associated protein [Sulfurospirillum sp.]|nr:YbaB/EbfC family nucleoid-associated protein [Sulfurospirillum sp.]